MDRLRGEVVALEDSGRIAGPGFRLTVANVNVLAQPIEFRLQDKDAAIERLERRVRVEQAKGINLLRIFFTDPDARFAASVANTTAKFFQQYRGQVARENAGRRREAILAQLVELADSVRAAQDVLLTYQSQSQLLNPNVEGNALMASRLQVENEIRSMKFDEGLLISLVSGLRSLGEDSESLQELMVLGRDLVPVGATLHSRLQTLQQERTSLTASRFGATANDPRVETIDSLVAETRELMRLASSQALELLRVRAASSEARLSEIRSEIGSLPARSAEFDRLQQQVNGVQGIFNGLVQQYYQTEIAESSATGDVHIVDPATEPLWPDPSRHQLNLIISLLTGLILGGLAAAAIDSLDQRIRGARDARTALGLNVLGTIPRINGKAARSATALMAREAFRSVRTNLDFSGLRFPLVIAVTSPAPGDGKSTISANLALAFADQGTRVLLIDADLRRSRLHRFVGIDPVPGLSDVVDNTATLSAAVRRRSTNGKGLLAVLPSGSPTRDPSRLFTDSRFPTILQRLRSEYDVIVIDTPPLLAVLDSLPVARVADTTVLVARANRTHAGALIDAVDQLRMASVSVAGIVLNDLPPSATPYYKYREYYADGEREKQKGLGANLAAFAFDGEWPKPR
jgi:tyrosine-protein kinase Etk/Wzc